MAVQLFKVTDNKDGSSTIVQARTKTRASKHVAGTRFSAQKATPSEITEFVNGGNKFDVADAENAEVAPSAPTSEEVAAPAQAE